jgi:hypothetical protein
MGLPLKTRCAVNSYNSVSPILSPAALDHSPGTAFLFSALSCAVALLRRCRFLAPPLTCTVPPLTWAPGCPRGQPRGPLRLAPARRVSTLPHSYISFAISSFFSISRFMHLGNADRLIPFLLSSCMGGEMPRIAALLLHARALFRCQVPSFLPNLCLFTNPVVSVDPTIACLLLSLSPAGSASPHPSLCLPVSAATHQIQGVSISFTFCSLSHVVYILLPSPHLLCRQGTAGLLRLLLLYLRFPSLGLPFLTLFRQSTCPLLCLCFPHLPSVTAVPSSLALTFPLRPVHIFACPLSTPRIGMVFLFIASSCWGLDGGGPGSVLNSFCTPRPPTRVLSLPSAPVVGSVHPSRPTI